MSGHSHTKFNLRIYLFKLKVILCQINFFLACSISVFTAKNISTSHILCSLSCKKQREFRSSENRIGWVLKEVLINQERACILGAQLCLSDFNANKCMGMLRHIYPGSLCRFTLFYIHLFDIYLAIYLYEL